MYTNSQSIFHFGAEVIQTEAQAINQYVMDNHEKMTHDEKLNCHQRILNLTHLMWGIEDQTQKYIQDHFGAEELTKYLCEADEINANLFGCCNNTAKYI